MEYYFSVIVFCLVTSITPGPNTVMLMTSGLNHGVKKSMPHYWGVNIGFALMVTAIGFGLGAIFTLYPMVHQLIKLVGIVYLLFLAWKIANAGHANNGGSLSAPFTFIQAAAFQWVNPKAWVIAVGAIAAFTTGSNINADIIFIVLSYFVVGLVSMAVWLILGASLQRLLSSTKSLRRFNITMAIFLVLSIIPMIQTELSAVS